MEIISLFERSCRQNKRHWIEKNGRNFLRTSSTQKRSSDKILNLKIKYIWNYAEMHLRSNFIFRTLSWKTNILFWTLFLLIFYLLPYWRLNLRQPQLYDKPVIYFRHVNQERLYSSNRWRKCYYQSIFSEKVINHQNDNLIHLRPIELVFKNIGCNILSKFILILKRDRKEDEFKNVTSDIVDQYIIFNYMDQRPSEYKS